VIAVPFLPRLLKALLEDPFSSVSLKPHLQFTPLASSRCPGLSLHGPSPPFDSLFSVLRGLSFRRPRPLPRLSYHCTGRLSCVNFSFGYYVPAHTPLFFSSTFLSQKFVGLSRPPFSSTFVSRCLLSRISSFTLFASKGFVPACFSNLPLRRFFFN